jgi:subtilisin family serine protease
MILAGFFAVLSIFSIQSRLFAETSDIVPNRYIVVFKDDVADPEIDSDDLKQRHALVKFLVFRHALKGFAATIPPAKLKEVLADPRVAFVSPERIFHTTAQYQPTGIDRINAEVSTSAGRTGLRIDNSQPVDVAVIDTGIDLTHPDLAANIGGSVNFIDSSRNGNDDNGHGSHVAGTIAAVNNDLGVVGVAPNARLWAVKVLNANGAGLTSTIIAGIDWVTASRNTPGREPIEVANMSLGGLGRDDGRCGLNNRDAMHQAICKSILSGVTYVVAAGNDGRDTTTSTPGAYKEVITVSAMAETDGRPGGLGPGTPYGGDDRFATFSNWGAPVDLIAPGVNIASTYKNGSYAVLSGTSMASPHVAGAAALYIAAHPTATPFEVRDGLIAAGVIDWNTATDRDPAHEPRVDACRASGLTACP